MRKSRFTEEQKVAIVQQAGAGAKIGDLCRKHGITETTFYHWRAKYDGCRCRTPSDSEHSRMRIVG